MRLQLVQLALVTSPAPRADSRTAPRRGQRPWAPIATRIETTSSTAGTTSRSNSR
jgi:hypothetical protein